MPKRIIQRRKGKGSPRFTSPGHRFKGAIKIRPYDETERNGMMKGVVRDIYHDAGKNAPIMLVEYENSTMSLYPAPQGIAAGQVVESGAAASIKDGSVVPLGKIPEGTFIYCLERKPGSGAKFVRSSGSFARVVAHEAGGVIVQMPSRNNIMFQPECRAIIGKISGAGRKEKPFVKAANRRFAREARGKKHMIVKGTAISAGNHPHGGGGRRNKKNWSVSRNAPPGAKVGSIAPRRTGLRRGVEQ